MSPSVAAPAFVCEVSSMVDVALRVDAAAYGSEKGLLIHAAHR